MESRGILLLRLYLSLFMAVQTEGVTPEELAELVEKNNMSRTGLGERLSNQVYHYDKERQRLLLATDTPNKRLDSSAPKQNRKDGKNQSR